MKKLLGIAIAASALALFAAAGFAHDYQGYGQGYGHMGWFGGTGWHHGESWDGNDARQGYHHRGRYYRGRYAGDNHPCAYGWNRDYQRPRQENPTPRDENR